MSCISSVTVVEATLDPCAHKDGNDKAESDAESGTASDAEEEPDADPED